MARDEDATELDQRRLFRRADVRRVWERQGRLCALCNRSLPFDLIHGDHIHPWSKGGRTEPSNCQALCGSCNLRKGSSPQEVVRQFFNAEQLRAGSGSLRKWQAEALETVLPKLRAGKSVLVEACPGAGKTHFSLEVASRLLHDGAISRVLIIVPTRGIAAGWAEAAGAQNRMSPTIPLRSAANWRTTEPIDLGGGRWAGAIATYQSLARMPDMFLAHVTDPGERTLVVFDEVHHAGTEGSWGEAAQEAFADTAAAILSLSGTPFRTDRNPIVFVESALGASKADFVYGYADAIDDGACRPVQFVEARGLARFEGSDGRVLETFFGDERQSDTGQRKMLRAALEWMGPDGIAARMLRDANEYLVGLRLAGDRDAAGLVVCVDCDHADLVAGQMAAHLVSRRPVVACSTSNDVNDSSPAEAIRRFKTSTDPWLVAVNMVSEGVDIRRLRTVVYLTNRMTLLAFRQIVGRVVRSDPSNESDHGRVYVPGDPRLLQMARTIQDEVQILPPPIPIMIESPAKPAELRLHGDRVDTDWAVETFGAQGEVFDTQDRSARAELVTRCRSYIEERGMKATDPESLAMLAMANPELMRRIEEATS